MSENKTKETTKSVTAFLNSLTDENKRKDCKAVLKLMKDVTGESPKMWGESMVGFGSYHYRYASGREGDFFLTGFSPRKQNLTVYMMAGFERYPKLMKSLGKYKTGKSCLYIKRLEDINLSVLKELLKLSVKYIAELYT